MDPIEFANLPRDTKRESEVSKWLRTLGEAEKFEFIWRVLRLNPIVAFPLIEKSQLKPLYLEVILEHGFVYGDASTVKQWYMATVNGLGISKVIRLVEAHMGDAPLIVEKMLYWLRPESKNLINKVDELKKQFASKYPKFSSGRSTGIHPTNV